MILTGQPYKKYTTTGSGSLRRAHHRWVVPTDHGELLAEQVADALGITLMAVRTRISRLIAGDIKPEALFLPRRDPGLARKFKITRREMTDEINRVPDEDRGKFAHLSDRARDNRLRSIPGCGRWEAQQ